MTSNRLATHPKHTRRCISMLLYLMALWLLQQPAEAILVPSRYSIDCVRCGYRLVRPLSNRSVSPQHQLEIEFYCPTDLELPLPELRQQDGSVVPSIWEQRFAGAVGENAIRRYVRTGPALPEGTLTLGGNPRQCSLSIERKDTRNRTQYVYCSDKDDSCCEQLEANSLNSPFIPVLTFDVNIPAQDAADAAEPSLEPTLRCRANPEQEGVELFLDTIESRIPPQLVGIDLEIESSALDEPQVVIWDGQLCAGQQLRQFLGFGSLTHPSQPVELSFSLHLRDEDGPYQETSGQLRIPEDCVETPAVGLTFQRLNFTAWCPDSASGPLYLSPTLWPETQKMLPVGAGGCEATTPLFPDEPEPTSQTPPAPAPPPAMTTVPSEPPPEPQSLPATQASTTEPEAPAQDPSPAHMPPPGSVQGSPPQTRSCSVALSGQNPAPWSWCAALTLLLAARRRTAQAARRATLPS